jgi:hypothetical protein
VAKEEGSEEAATEEPIDARECTASSYSPPRKRPFPMQTPVTHLDTQLQPNHPQIEFSRPQSLVGSRCHCDSFRDLSAHTHILILSALYLQPCMFSLVPYPNNETGHDQQLPTSRSRHKLLQLTNLIDSPRLYNPPSCLRSPYRLVLALRKTSSGNNTLTKRDTYKTHELEKRGSMKS